DGVLLRRCLTKDRHSHQPRLASPWRRWRLSLNRTSPTTSSLPPATTFVQSSPSVLASLSSCRVHFEVFRRTIMFPRKPNASSVHPRIALKIEIMSGARRQVPSHLRK